MPQISPINWLLIFSIMIPVLIIYHSNIPIGSIFQTNIPSINNNQNPLNW